MASLVYNNYKARMLGLGTMVDLDGDTIKLSLHTSSYTPADGDDFYNDVTNEVGASGSYSAGGATLSVTLTQDNTDDEGVFDATDVSFTAATITARGAVIRKDTGVSSTSPLVCYIDFGSNQTSTAGTFTITFASEGIININ